MRKYCIIFAMLIFSIFAYPKNANTDKLIDAVTAVKADSHQEAIKSLEELRNGWYQASQIEDLVDRVDAQMHWGNLDGAILTYQLLFQEYQAVNEIDKSIEVLKEAISFFPSEPWFVQNLTYYYISIGKVDKAYQYASDAVKREPKIAQYHYMKGAINEMNNNDEALTDYNNALELDPNNLDAIVGKGRVLLNKAFQLNDDAVQIEDYAAYQKIYNAALELYKQALPYYEKAHQLDPQNKDYITTLKMLYYRFHDDAKYKEMDEKLKKL